MCGRACCVLQPEEVIKATHTTVEDFVDQDKYSPHYNVSPGMATPILYQDKATKHLVVRPMKWGLIPSYMKPDEKVNHFMRFNARSESMAETPAYRQLVDQKRCVVLFNGFYEWQKLGKSDKQPYFIHLAGSPIMRIAGLFDAWRNDEGNITYTYSIITTESPPKMKWIHTRMPLILRDADEADRWLADEAADKRFKPFLSLVRPYPHDDLTYYPVTKQVGHAAFDSDACMAKVDVRVAGKITSFYKQMDGASIKKEDQAESVAPDPFIPLNTERSDCADDAALLHHVSSSPTRVSFKRPADGACPLTCMPPPDKWNCDACTFENAGDAKMCAMCDGRRELPLAEWTCATCTFANAFTTSSCSMCHASRAPRPTLMPKKTKIGESPQKPITSFFSKQ